MEKKIYSFLYKLEHEISEIGIGLQNTDRHIEIARIETIQAYIDNLKKELANQKTILE